MIATMTSFASTAFSLQVRRSRSSKFCPKNAIFHGLRSLLWPTEEKARRQTFYWQSNSDSKLGTYQRKKSSVTWTARKKAVKKKLQSSTAKQSHARCKPPKQPLTGNCASKVKSAFPPGRVTAVKKNTNPDPGPRGQLHLSCRVHSANWQPALPAPLPGFSTCVYSALTARKFLFSTRSHTD